MLLASINGKTNKQVITNKDQLYNFIVVSARPVKCSVAAQLAGTASRPYVLLLEARHLSMDYSSYMAIQKYNNLANLKIVYHYKSTLQD